MTCPDAEALEHYATGGADGASGLATHRHVAACPECRRALGEIEENLRCAQEVAQALCTEGAGRALPAVEIAGLTLVRERGRGGMGVVYEAMQDRPRRRVAVKIMRAGGRSERAMRRFELEAEILARLQHPGIARIHGAGVLGAGGDRRPYFIMELIEGRPLLHFVATERLDRDRRLRLFVRLCDAVQHAHQKGVIHRDLKPANVLVTDDGDPKILDFGVARAAGPDPGDSLHTLAGEVLGTLPYMSPEQMGGAPEGVDLRADVYSLGVILYELLAGRRPIDIGSGSITEALLKVQRDEPTPLGAVVPACRGDLESIARKALEKDAERRYPSAAELAADVRRFLNDEPVEARRAGTAYQLAKFARRHRALVGGVAAVFVALLLGVAGITAQWLRARDAEREATRQGVAARAAQRAAELETGTARAISDFLMKSLTQASPDQRAGESASIDEAFAFASRGVDRDFADRPQVRAELHHTIGWTFMRMGQLDRARAHLEQALALGREHFGPTHWRTAAAVAALGQLELYQRNWRRGVELLEEALAVRLAMAADARPPELLENRLLANNYTYLAIARRALGELDEAVRLAELAVEHGRLVAQDFPRDYCMQLSNAAAIALDAGRVDEQVEVRVRESLAVGRAQPGHVAQELCEPLGTLARLRLAQGRRAAAFLLIQRTASLAELFGRPVALPDVLREWARAFGPAGGPEPEPLAAARRAFLLAIAGDVVPARAALDALDPLLVDAPDEAWVAEALLVKGRAHLACGDLEAAETALVLAAARGERQRAGDAAFQVELDDLLGATYLRMRLLDAAELHLVEAFERARDAGLDVEVRHRAAFRLVRLYRELGDTAEADRYQDLLEGRG